jgi:nucleoside-diphosphate-sugar epimerase
LYVPGRQSWLILLLKGKRLETRCLVLGGKGFIGAHLVRALVGAGYRVRVFDRPGLVSGSLAELGAAVEFLDGDFSDAAAVRQALIGCEVCFHLVSTTLPKSSNDDPAYDVQSNVVGTLAMLDAARLEGLKKIVFLSSGGTVYGIPRYTPIDEQHPTDPTCSYLRHYKAGHREVSGAVSRVVRSRIFNIATIESIRGMATNACEPGCSRRLPRQGMAR